MSRWPRNETRAALADAVKPRFFRTAADFRRWLGRNSGSATELLVGYFKRDSGKPSVTWPETVDHALCHGWIDGVRKRIDATRYTIRFTPRKPTSTWSAVNVGRVAELERLGLMRPAGRAAFGARRENRSGIYSYEQRPHTLPAPYAAVLRANTAAHRHFGAEAPSYRRAVIWWVVSAKQETTRLRRLDQLIDDSALGKRIKQFGAPNKR